MVYNISILIEIITSYCHLNFKMNTYFIDFINYFFVKD